MDSSSSSPPNSTNNNSLAFSLSNHFPNPSSSPLSLFHSFTYPSLSLTGSNTVDAPPEPTAGAGPTNLSIFTGGPKFEDFLGGSAATATTVACAPPQLPQFSTDNNNHLYDSELKSTIAACFPRALAAEQSTEPQKPSPKKTVDTFGQRTSIYRGVTRHRWTGRYEAHLWDNSCRREGQSRKGRQEGLYLTCAGEGRGVNRILTVLCFVSLRGFCTWGIIADSWGSFAHYAVSVYLGGYDKEDKAARAYDLAALKYWGPTTTTNFPISNYEKELEEMKNMTRQEFVASLRRKSSGFSRGASIYRGVTRHHQHGRWQARIGRVAGNKDLYLGTFSTQEEAAEAYDIAAIKFRGLNAVTNFDMSRYDVKSIANSTLPIGGLSGKNKNSTDSASESKSHEPSQSDGDPSSASSVTFASQQQPSSSNLSFAIPIKQDPSDYWSILGYHNTPLDNSGIRNTTSTVTTTTFPSSNNGTASSLTPFNMEFSSAPSSTGSDNNAAFFSGGGIFVQQQTSHGHGNASSGSSSSSLSCSIPFATPIFSLNSNTSYESSAGYGNWIGPTLHTFQSHAKPSLFQTPIFGME
ncbi:AP2-like ethylene-responsive transcription factor AIL5 isoform B [Glycine soja]|uniref:AP2-like ethylene-responsive transcription factor AIL5 isoform B n=1 Tax=Glycine soja TaxID=3848 RepID=A0A445G383_GLYSO|nr:AP2-like ethylene-responsive transcription factor AIL5 isoform B [Glycine soja]